MQLAFTTLGCPEWDMATIIGRAIDYGFDGVDFRGYRGALALPTLPEFSTARADTAARLRDANLAVCGFSSSACVCSKPAEALAEVRAYAALCPIFGTRFIRVFGGAIGTTPRAQAITRAGATLRAAAVIAADAGAQVVFETHDDWRSAAHVAAVLEEAQHPAAGVLWDVHHPYRTLGEAPRETWRLLGRWIRYTHFKDSRRAADTPRGYQYCATGTGDVPLAEIVAILQAGGYDGWYTLEWEKQWLPELAEPEEAFPAFVRYMRGLTPAR